MPRDLEQQVLLGAAGVNLRDQPSVVGITGLVDSLNWRLDQHGALVKRLGYVTYPSSGQLAAKPLEQATFNPNGATAQLVFYCDDGHVYKSPGNGTFTSIASGLSTSARPSFAMLNEKIYWANGTDQLQQWDGTTVTAIAAAPVGKYLGVWRNRLWVSGVGANPNRVYWSDIGDGGAWTHSLNYVDILGPRGDAVTGLISAPNIGSSFDGADGILVYKNRSTHRIFDDTDNVTGAVVGGGNVMIDSATGCVNARTLVGLNSRIYGAATNGVYSTNGHDPLVLETAQLGDLFSLFLAQAQQANMTAIAWQGNYLVAVTPQNQTSNTLTLELYASLERSPGQGPIMPLSLPVKAWSVYPSATGDQLYFCDASQAPSDNRKWVRLYQSGGADTDGSATLLPITATARTGATLFGTEHEKRIRRLQVVGRGQLTIGVVTDFETGSGDQQQFLLTVATNPTLWNSFNWNQADWSGAGSGGVAPLNGFYDTRGRYFGFVISETSSAASQTESVLGITAQPAGGAALFSVLVKYTPLDSEVAA